jgi:hypothetical protein
LNGVYARSTGTEEQRTIKDAMENMVKRFLRSRARKGPYPSVLMLSASSGKNGARDKEVSGRKNPRARPHEGKRKVQLAQEEWRSKGTLKRCDGSKFLYFLLPAINLSFTLFRLLAITEQ